MQGFNYLKVFLEMKYLCDSNAIDTIVKFSCFYFFLISVFCSYCHQFISTVDSKISQFCKDMKKKKKKKKQFLFNG